MIDGRQHAVKLALADLADNRGPSTIGRVIHTSRSVGFTGAIDGVLCGLPRAAVSERRRSRPRLPTWEKRR
ncbi:MAG: hypothetical protein ACR2LU_02605 [Luteitalea sp.]